MQVVTTVVSDLGVIASGTENALDEEISTIQLQGMILIPIHYCADTTKVVRIFALASGGQQVSLSCSVEPEVDGGNLGQGERWVKIWRRGMRVLVDVGSGADKR